MCPTENPVILGNPSLVLFSSLMRLWRPLWVSVLLSLPGVLRVVQLC